VVFGVQKIFNLACGSFYALGAYAGVSAVGWYVGAGGPPALFIVPLALAGLAVGAVGIVVERGLLRFVYDRDETFQLLMTFAIVLMMEDAIRLTWGPAPRSTAGLYLTYGQLSFLGATAPVYNLIVIAASLAVALAIGWLLTRTAFGRIIRATADNREMAEALGVDMRRVYARVFTLGTALGTLGGALVIPTTAAMSEMGVELIVEAFAVVVIGRLGSMRGAFVGAVAPVYNLIVIAASLAIALAIGWLFTRTAFGRIIRATADNREMAEALGVDMRRVYAKVFTLGTALGTLGGALVIPATAAMSEMGIELIVEAFAVVVIGGLGSMRGAFVGALVVGILRAIAISVYPELEMLLIYLIVIAVLVARPRGLFGAAV